MNRQRLFNIMVNGDQLTADQESDLHLPTISTAAAAIVGDYEGSKGIRVKHIAGAISKTVIHFDGAEMTFADASQGLTIQLVDFPEGAFRVERAEGTLTFTTTTAVSSTLNGSKVLSWGVGTAAMTSTSALVAREANILGPVAATSSATISTANTATSGIRTSPILLRGHSTAPDVYLNVLVPTAGDIDGDATVEVDGTITIYHSYVGDIATANPDRMPSAAIWDECPWDDIAAGRVDGFVAFDDFVAGNMVLANNKTTGTALENGWVGQTAATGGTTISMEADEPYGVVSLNATTDDEDAIISWLCGGNTAGQVVFQAGKRLWFEARVKCSNITDSKYGVFCGFAEEALCDTTELIAAAGTLADKDYVGFHRLEGDGDKFDIVFNTASGSTSPVTVEADAVTIAADTYLKLGIYCDGTTVYFYADGTLVDSVALTATDFPDGEEMAFYFGLMAAHADDASAQIDWVKIAQQRA